MALEVKPVKRQVRIVGISLALAWIIALSPVGRAAARTGGFCSAGDNTASGGNALPVNTTGIDNSAFGDGALFSNTSGSSNTALGVNALVTNTMGGSNTATGVERLNLR